jgi:acyl-CoA synthetase (NDP forming)
MSWKMNSLDRLFNPKAVAVIGASEKPEKLGALSLLALRNFQGPVVPVNPAYNTINKRVCYPSVDKAPHSIDLALVAVGPSQVPEAIRECAEAQVGGAVVFSAGFKELGEIGGQHQREVKEIADRGHVAIIGPNCLGAGNLDIHLNATFFPHPVPLRAGNVGLVSQSGGVTGLMLYRAADSNVGVSKFASIGNRVNIDFHDMVRYLRSDDKTRTICLFIEGTESAREMTDEIARTTPEKQIIVYKVGRTPASRSAALSHTGSLAGNADIYSAALKQARALEVGSVTEMIDMAKILSISPVHPKGKRVAVVTHTLGIALIAAQTLEENGAILPPPSSDIIRAVQNLVDLPIDLPIKNPIDVLAKGWAEPTVFSGAFKAALESELYDSVVICFSPNFLEGIGGGIPVSQILETVKETQKPVVCVLSAPYTKPPPGYEKLEEAGVSVFFDPGRAGQALANVLKLAQ